MNQLNYFATLVEQDDSIPLFEAALAIAQDAPQPPDLSATLSDLDALAVKLASRLTADAPVIQKLRMLNYFFYQELGFSGNINDYYNPENSYLHRVLHTRRGIPISLAVIYMELARSIGLDVRGISFPGHFLMKLSVQSGDIILDPISGTSLSKEELEERLEPFVAKNSVASDCPLSFFLQEASPRAILTRMLRNLKNIFTEQELWHRLLDVQQRLVVLLPDEPSELRDRGLAYARIECPQAALDDLEAYIDATPNADDAASLEELMVELREAVRRLN